MKKIFFGFFIADLLLVTLSFLFFIWLKPASLANYLPNYRYPFLLFAAIWLLTSLIMAKFDLKRYAKIQNLFAVIIRCNFIVLIIILLLMFIFHRFQYSRFIVLGTICLSTFLEFIFSGIVFYYQKKRNGYDVAAGFSLKPFDVEPEDNCQKIIDLKLTLPPIDDPESSIDQNLKDKYLKNFPDLYDFISDNVPLSLILKAKSLILDTNTFFNFENLDPESQYFFLNLHKVNDYRRINQYFIQINRNLRPGGFFVGCGETIAERYIYYFTTYPKPLAVFFYCLDSFFRRVIPKLQGFKQVYFYLTKGRNRALSKAEILGRLFYCGFNVIETKEITNRLYYIAQKVGEPKNDTNPTYGPFVKMKRVGKDKKILNIYKFRTMHPYSEYLQAYMYRESNLEAGGKICNDFRIAGWGKIFRKLWIDELPQFINLIRGDISLMGVRALSEHYFSLYPPDLQELRTQFKPGLVPPFYVDMPIEFEEILESERKYLLKRQQKPISTQVEYFCKAWWNIIVKRARSK
jgi:hypothetical protein